jgi:hypothetical protein
VWVQIPPTAYLAINGIPIGMSFFLVYHLLSLRGVVLPLPGSSDCRTLSSLRTNLLAVTIPSTQQTLNTFSTPPPILQLKPLRTLSQRLSKLNSHPNSSTHTAAQTFTHTIPSTQQISVINAHLCEIRKWLRYFFMSKWDSGRKEQRATNIRIEWVPGSSE